MKNELNIKYLKGFFKKEKAELLEGVTNKKFEEITKSVLENLVLQAIIHIQEDIEEYKEEGREYED